MIREFVVRHKQSGGLYLVGAENAVQAERFVVGTISCMSGKDHTEDEFIAQDKPTMLLGDVLDLNEIDDCEEERSLYAKVRREV